LCDFPIWILITTLHLPRSPLLLRQAQASLPALRRVFANYSETTCPAPAGWPFFSAYAPYSTCWHCSSTSQSLLLTTRSRKKFYHWSASFVRHFAFSDSKLLLTTSAFHYRGHCLSWANCAFDTLNRHQRTSITPLETVTVVVTCFVRLVLSLVIRLGPVHIQRLS
jgi:hypothetical protein